MYESPLSMKAAPKFKADQAHVIIGDVLETLRTLPDGLVQTCVTSPPYFGLRDYGTRHWFGGNNPDCEHGETRENGPHHPGQVEQTKWKKAEAAGKGQTATTRTCVQCGGWYGQLGLEPTPELYVEHLVEVFRELKRVLRDDGTFWLNVGDSAVQPVRGSIGKKSTLGGSNKAHDASREGSTAKRGIPPQGDLKAKDLLGIPWMLAFALRKDGWYLRQEVIWDKPNTMPQSMRDRPTRAHEQIFLFSKSRYYFYDADAVLEPVTRDEGDRAWRNRRSVWSINTQPYKGAHFAVFPPELPELCIKAGTSEKGCCSSCGAPWIRIYGKVSATSLPETSHEDSNPATSLDDDSKPDDSVWGHQEPEERTPQALGWKPGCGCGVGDPAPCLVLDTFAGSGTTLAVASSLGRDHLGIEVNESYLDLIEQRMRQVREVSSTPQQVWADLPED